MASDTQSISSGSDAGSTPEEERIRRLFQTCDGNGDGYIDSQDLMAVCCQLNLEHCVEEIMEQLGADENGRISYDEFLRRRMRLMNEINALTLDEQGQQDVNDQISPAPGSSSTGNWPSSSDTSQGAISGKHESWEFDSGARDLSPEPNSLQKLIEAAGVSISSSEKDLVELANKLHLTAISSLKGQVVELNNRLQHSVQDRDLLERQFNRSHMEKMRMSREQEDRLGLQAQRYEERIIELHSIIAELSRKLEIQRSNVIKEEDEMSQQSGDDSRISETQSHCTSNDNMESSSEKGEITEISRPLKTALQEETSSGVGDYESSDERVLPGEESLLHLREELFQLRSENSMLQEQMTRQEAEMNRTRANLLNARDDRDKLYKKVKELQSRLSMTGVHSQSSQGSQAGSSPSHINLTLGEKTLFKDEHPVTKLAERVKLKKVGSASQLFGPDISCYGFSSTKMAEHLVQNVQEDSNTQEIVLSAGFNPSDSSAIEFEVEMERLHSKIEHLKSQNDLLHLTFEESKGQCDRLSMLLGKYESNTTALQLALSYSDQAVEVFEILLALLETEQGLILANCRAAGLGALVSGSDSEEQEEVTSLLQRALDNRKSAETVAHQFVRRLDRNYGCAMSSSCSPWEDLSSLSHATSTSSSNSSMEGDFGKVEEQRLRDYIIQLKSDRAAVKTTVVELESIHVDPSQNEPSNLMDAQKLDLENAVLMQELMAMKEEKAELKAHVYLLEKEKTGLDLQLSSREAQQHSYLVQIEHLKIELKESQKKPSEEDSDSARKEQKMKQRIQELLQALEKVTKNSEIRAQQSSEFVNDLKRANSALVSVYEKSKKKHQAKWKKFESQMSAMAERHSAQIRLLKQRIAMLEGDLLHLPGSDSSV